MRRIRPLLLALAIPAAPLAAQSPQQYELQGTAIEVYNLVGSALIEAGSGERRAGGGHPGRRGRR